MILPVSTIPNTDRNIQNATHTEYP